jgi:hypothetical protein
MSDRIRIIKHEAAPGSGSFEVWFPDGRASQFFYWDDIPDRWLAAGDCPGGAGMIAVLLGIANLSSVNPS